MNFSYFFVNTCNNAFLENLPFELCPLSLDFLCAYAVSVYVKVGYLTLEALFIWHVPKVDKQNARIGRNACDEMDEINVD